MKLEKYIHDDKREDLKKSFNLFFSCEKDASEIFYRSEPVLLGMRFYANSINQICSDFQILDDNFGNIINFYPMNLIYNENDWKNSFNSFYTPPLYFKQTYSRTQLQLGSHFIRKNCFNFKPP